MLVSRSSFQSRVFTFFAAARSWLCLLARHKTRHGGTFEVPPCPAHCEKNLSVYLNPTTDNVGRHRMMGSSVFLATLCVCVRACVCVCVCFRSFGAVEFATFNGRYLASQIKQLCGVFTFVLRLFVTCCSCHHVKHLGFMDKVTRMLPHTLPLLGTG